MGGGEGEQSQYTAPHFPGTLPSWQRYSGSSKAASGPDDCHALGCQRDSSRAQLSWSKEQRKNHREQLLPPLVKQRKRPLPYPNLTQHNTTHTHEHAHTPPPLCPARRPVSCGSGVNRRKRVLGPSLALVELQSEAFLFFCANIFTFCPLRTFPLSA